MSEENQGLDLESLQSAEINLQNLAVGNPAIADHPMFKITVMQLKQGLGEHSTVTD